ncbi:2-keto-4-pentenoate hydratase [Bordetella genomosp. 13]|uniref:2-keto-4-pentenoate hydratase n=1 Tax=Bordetella genomosp. 13 TaxID=463040 RepID=UPI0011A22BEE|nr:hydratase [Bordetella genomosp. 13]
MNTSAYDPAPAAELLAAAWRGAPQLKELPADQRPADLDQGYQLQDRFVAVLGTPTAGWKLGLGSPASLRAAQLKRPLIGRLLKTRVHAAGATVRLTRPDTAFTVEFEIAFVLARDIAPGDAPANVLDAVASTHPAFELVQSRFTDRRAVGLPSFIGDGVGFDAFVLGAEIAAGDIDGVIASARVEVDGVPHAQALEGDDLSYPLDSLRYLYDFACERGITLRKGEIVTAGAIAKPFDLPRAGVSIAGVYAGGELRASLARA